MTDLAPNHEPHWPPVGTGLWTRWWGYLVRWLVFGLVVHLFQPVDSELDLYWIQKLDQALIGLAFGWCRGIHPGREQIQHARVRGSLADRLGHLAVRQDGVRQRDRCPG
jgi:hypothetical protein